MGIEILKPLFRPVLSQWEINWLKNKQPELIYNSNHKILYGTFHFDAKYEGIRIIDKYRLIIDLSPKIKGLLPIVYEIDNRIKRAAKIRGIKLIDLHTYENGEQCLIRPDQFFERYRFGIFMPQFINHLTTHFYWQAHVEKYGKEPWQGEKHGWDPKEILEWMNRLNNCTSI